MGAQYGSHACEARRIASTHTSRLFCQPWHWVWILAGCATVLLFTLLNLEIEWGHLSTKYKPSFNLPTTGSSNVRDFTITLNPNEHNDREAHTRTFSWNITSALLRPDGVNREVILINDYFPGPTIEARSGDNIVVNVHNHLEQGISFHWHGLQMRGMSM